MQFEWDERKADSNARKHGVAFEVAELVWDDPAHIVLFDRYAGSEERWHAIGLVRGVTVLTVIHINHDDVGGELIRIIGARRATRAERNRYEAQDD